MCPIATTLANPPRPRTDFSLVFPPEPGWVRTVRQAVRTALADVHRDELIEMAALLTSEVVTNAVNASRISGCSTPIGVHAEWATGGVRVQVHDGAPGLPELAPPRRPEPGQEPERGHGMLLVSACASDWGVCRHGPGIGKAVWFLLAC
ncbi:ATP-binding protein [Streptomyces sp. AV19]|uniref:ATP-binding protein n=1 Tax=Streptomyces sp. AV19 TaxID=2793068 RepID=UPI0018FEC222|nr:ATP-binding protein [Streptomyces sp. AV19]MBH1936191.1 ATP-binding protein [Streptomyces sp. AV19]MDG4534621.1 ATP-binding protein [Streptomyces sp. AV19]